MVSVCNVAESTPIKSRLWKPMELQAACPGVLSAFHLAVHSLLTPLRICPAEVPLAKGPAREQNDLKMYIILGMCK